MSDINNTNSNKEAEALLGATSYQNVKKTIVDIAVDDVSNKDNQRSRFKSWMIFGTSILLLAAAGFYTGSSSNAINHTQTSVLRSGNFCLTTLTGVVSSFAIEPIQNIIRSMDPINVVDRIEREIANAQLPGGCTASATVWTELLTISGLDTTNLDITLQPGGTCIIGFIRSTFSATWRLSKELTTLDATVRAGIKSKACGKAIDLTASGTASIPLAYFNGDVLLGGSVTLTSASGQVDNARIERIDFDIPSIDANFLVTSPLKDFKLEGVLEDFINEEFRTVVAERIKSFVNENIDGRLPISFPQ